MTQMNLSMRQKHRELLCNTGNYIQYPIKKNHMENNLK